MLYTPSKIKSINQCPFSGYLSTAKYHTSKNKYLHILDLYKEAISENIDLYGDFFDDNALQSFYTFEQERQVDRNLFQKQLNRLRKYLVRNNAKVIDSNVSRKIKILGQEVLVKADLVIQFPNRIELVKLSTSSPKLTYAYRSDSGNPDRDINLYLIQLLGEQLYPDRAVSSAIYSLNGKNDGHDSKNKENREDYDMWLAGESDELHSKLSSLEFERDAFYNEGKKQKGNGIRTKVRKLQSILEFEPKLEDDKPSGSHIIRQFNADVKYIEGQLQKVFNTELSMDSEKCVSNDCKDCQYKVLCDAKSYNKVELEKVVEKKTGFGKKKSFSPTKGQQEYLDFTEGVARINAGAGSGKTATSVQRNANLLEEVAPQDIIMITFTNKGAEEMAHRIEQISDYNARDLRISTFNSFGMNIIENEYETLGYTQKPELIDKIDKIEIIKEILKMEEFSDLEWLNYKYPMLNMPNAKGAVYFVLDWFNAFSQEDMESVDEFMDVLKNMYCIYRNILATRNKLEYSDQINKAILLLSEDNSLVEKYGAVHITLDEAQDTDDKQFEFLKLLTQSSKFKSLAIIGDTAQAIYGFRGTSPKNMIELDKHFPDYIDIFMEDNFRSSEEICSLGNRLDQLCNTRVNKKMVSFSGRHLPWRLAEYNTLSEEYETIAQSIQNLIEVDEPLEDIAIISRNGKELLEIQKVLNSKGIPNRLATPQRHMNNHNIRLMIGLAKYLMTEELDTNDYYLFEYASAINSNVDFLEEIEDFVSELKQAISDSDEWGLDRLDIFIRMCDALVENDEVASVFINNLLDSRQWHTFNEFASHLQKHITYQDDSQAEKDENKYKAITLTTAHSSKGLEWNTVFTTINKFHYDDIKDDLNLLDEERRLLFVTVTRAKRHLYISYNTSQDKKRNKGKYCGFADEINMSQSDIDEHKFNLQLNEDVKEALSQMSPEDRLFALAMMRDDFPH